MFALEMLRKTPREAVRAWALVCWDSLDDIFNFLPGHWAVQVFYLFAVQLRETVCF